MGLQAALVLLVLRRPPACLEGSVDFGFICRGGLVVFGFVVRPFALPVAGLDG